MQTTEPKGKTWVPAGDVCARYGNISTMTLWRWLRDPDLGFPQRRYINRRRYWDEAELDEFDRLAEREGGRLNAKRPRRGGRFHRMRCEAYPATE